jgi:hypothetical protein
MGTAERRVRRSPAGSFAKLSLIVVVKHRVGPWGGAVSCCE